MKTREKRIVFRRVNLPIFVLFVKSTLRKKLRTSRVFITGPSFSAYNPLKGSSTIPVFSKFSVDPEPHYERANIFVFLNIWKRCDDRSGAEGGGRGGAGRGDYCYRVTGSFLTHAPHNKLYQNYRNLSH